MKIKYLFLLAVPLYLTSCGEQQQAETFKNSAELDQVWLGERTIKFVGNQAHSGERVSVTDSATEYGLGLARKMGDILAHGPVKRVGIKLWVNSSIARPTAHIVVSVGEGGKTISWVGYPFDKHISEANKWKQVNFEYIFTPADLENPENKLFNVFMWNNGKKATILADDLEVEFSPEEE